MNPMDFMQGINDIDEELIQSSMVFLQEDSMKHTIKRGGSALSKIILVAAVLAGILGVTAVAAETFPSIFGQLKRKYADMEAQEAADLYERAAEVNETFEAEYVPLPELDESQIVIGETYYDGPNFMIAYRLDQTAVPAQFGYGPDSEGFEDMSKMVFFCEHQCDAFEDYLERGCWSQEIYDRYVGYAKEYEDKYGIDFIHHYNTMEALWTMQEYLTEEEFDRAMKELKETGHVGVVMREMHVGDFIRVEGGEYLQPTPEGMMYGEERTDYGRVITCNVFDQILPDQYQDQDTLTLTLEVRASNQYAYIDKELGGLRKAESAGVIQVPVTLTKTPQ